MWSEWECLASWRFTDCFDDRKPNAVAKRNYLQAEVENQYGQDHSTILRLLSGEELIEELFLSLKAGRKGGLFHYLPKLRVPNVLEVDSPNWIPIPPMIPIPCL